MKQRKIPQSKQAFRNDATGKLVLAVVVGLLPTLFFWQFIDLDLRMLRILIALLWVTVLGAWGLWVLLTTIKWDKNYYALTDDSLLLHKAGIFSSKQQFYRYDSILSVTSRQGPVGSHQNYGSIHISIPRSTETIVLHYVINPDEQAAKIKEAIAKKPGTQTLVH